MSMIQIMPVSDLRNNFTSIEKIVSEGNPVFLTKNGYGKMVVMSLESYSRLTNDIDDALEVADNQAKYTTERLSHKQVFTNLRKIASAKEEV